LPPDAVAVAGAVAVDVVAVEAEVGLRAPATYPAYIRDAHSVHILYVVCTNSRIDRQNKKPPSSPSVHLTKPRFLGWH
jgi:hypothetical protein